MLRSIFKDMTENTMHAETHRIYELCTICDDILLAKSHRKHNQSKADGWYDWKLWDGIASSDLLL